VAGVIGAGKQPGAGLAGVASAVKILPVRQANNSSDGTALGMAQGIVAAVEGGAKVINISASSFFPTAQHGERGEHQRVDGVVRRVGVVKVHHDWEHVGRLPARGAHAGLQPGYRLRTICM
jgi:hypothetical protein